MVNQNLFVFKLSIAVPFNEFNYFSIIPAPREQFNDLFLMFRHGSKYKCNSVSLIMSWTVRKYIKINKHRDS